jgi:exosortase J
MSASSASSQVTPGTHFEIDAKKLVDRPLFFGSCLSMLVAFGTLGLSPQLIHLWEVWTTDPLRSIGMLIMAVSIVLVLRVWRQSGWELRGSWWGLLPLAVAFSSIVLPQELIFTWVDGPLRVNFLTCVFPIYLYASGVILLFAGPRVWRQAWFPLALLLCAQPVPFAVEYLLDYPLQSNSAHIARSFAALIGFPPTTPELLKLMFTPDFGMFIAPGCDGMRGAIALGYTALIVGYLKRVSIARWFLYVSGAVLLGHLFNLIRLCALVLYYRIALGHHALESMAKQADYAIGGILFSVAVGLFLWVVFRKEGKPTATSDPFAACDMAGVRMQSFMYLKLAAFGFIVLFVVLPGVRAIQNNRENLAALIRNGSVTPKGLDDRMPKQFGDYRLIRAWQERTGGTTAIENGAYRTDASNELSLGIWLLPRGHTVRTSWLIRGESPEMHTTRSFVTARGMPVSFDTTFYSDGVTDSLTGDIYCTPSLCLSSPDNGDGVHLGLTKAIDFSTRGVRAVPIFFIVQTPHSDAPEIAMQRELIAESQSFLLNIDLNDLSKRFQ